MAAGSSSDDCDMQFLGSIAFTPPLSCPLAGGAGGLEGDIGVDRNAHGVPSGQVGQPGGRRRAWATSVFNPFHADVVRGHHLYVHSTSF